LILRSSDGDCEWLFFDRCRGFEIRPSEAVEIGIVATPNEISGADARKIEGAIGETKMQSVVRLGCQFIETAAFFGLLWTAPGGGVEDQTIARFEWSEVQCCGRFHFDSVRENPRDAASEDATVARCAAFDHGLMIRSGQEMRTQAT
jgi:hypothetical protein